VVIVSSARSFGSARARPLDRRGAERGAVDGDGQLGARSADRHVIQLGEEAVRRGGGGEEGAEGGERVAAELVLEPAREIHLVDVAAPDQAQHLAHALDVGLGGVRRGHRDERGLGQRAGRAAAERSGEARGGAGVVGLDADAARPMIDARHGVVAVPGGANEPGGRARLRRTRPGGALEITKRLVRQDADPPRGRAEA
jgi:hypothetical protein